MSISKKPKNAVPSYESLARLEQMLSLRTLAERTRKAYIVYIQKLALYTGRDPTELDEAQALGYLIHLKKKRNYSPSSMRTVCAALRFFYQFVCERSWKLFDLVRSPSAQTLPAVLTREEVKRLIGCVREPRFRVVLTLIYACGLRITEAINLEVRDMQPQQNRIHIRGGKGRKDRFVPATARTVCDAKDVVAGAPASPAALSWRGPRLARAPGQSHGAGSRGQGRPADVHRVHSTLRAGRPGGRGTQARGACPYAASLVINARVELTH